MYAVPSSVVFFKTPLHSYALIIASVPVISNFMMNLGGIKYPCAPFNGWFVSTEICRNLIERYQVSNHLARALKMDLNDPFLPQKVSTELEHAILYSFQRQGITIIDPLTVGKSFITHCKRERNCGRECPAQWSWIGGLVGKIFAFATLMLIS